MLKSGGIYGPEHARWLGGQVQRWAPEAVFTVLTDLRPSLLPEYDVVPLTQRLPGWWSKMELMSPILEGDLLYLDLDVVVCGPITDMFDVPRSTLLRGFVRTSGVNSSVMLLRAAEREHAHREWTRFPDEWMHRSGRGGDQVAIGQMIGGRCDRWQDVLPGRIVSFKHGLAGGKAPPGDGVSIVAFHGRPRPWDTKFNWVPNLPGGCS